MGRFGSVAGETHLGGVAVASYWKQTGLVGDAQYPAMALMPDTNAAPTPDCSFSALSNSVGRVHGSGR